MQAYLSIGLSHEISCFTRDVIPLREPGKGEGDVCTVSHYTGLENERRQEKRVSEEARLSSIFTAQSAGIIRKGTAY